MLKAITLKTKRSMYWNQNIEAEHFIDTPSIRPIFGLHLATDCKSSMKGQSKDFRGQSTDLYAHPKEALTGKQLSLSTKTISK